MKKLLIAILLTFTLNGISEERKIRVYADVVGDLYHKGHIEFFKKAKSLGDILIIGVLGDETVETYKRRPVLTLEERVAVIESCKYVDEVIVDCPLGVTEELLDHHKIDIVVHGDDFDPATLVEQYKPALDRKMMRIVSYTPGISTTEIIDRVLFQYHNSPHTLAKKGTELPNYN